MRLAIGSHQRTRNALNARWDLEPTRTLRSGQHVELAFQRGITNRTRSGIAIVLRPVRIIRCTLLVDRFGGTRLRPNLGRGTYHSHDRTCGDHDRDARNACGEQPPTAS